MHFIVRPTSRSRAPREAFVRCSSETTQKSQPQKGGDAGEAKPEGGGQKLAKKGQQLKEEMDALVDEIDQVLEENAEEFVKNYVQRGGQ